MSLINWGFFTNSSKKNEDEEEKEEEEYPPFSTVTLAVLVGGVSWVVAVAWSNMVETIFEYCYPNGKSQIRPRLFYFLIVTVLAILFIYYLTRILA